MFAIAARTGSFSAAAREFNVTQPSVSRNIAQLEADLGHDLFRRGARGLTLTPEGALLDNAVREGFRRIEEAVEELVSQGGKKPVVTLSLSSSFATHWFVPKLSEFYETFPSVDLRFELIPGALKGGAGTVDLAMRTQFDEDGQYDVWDFAPEIVIPVCSERYLERHGALDHASDGEGHVLLNLSDRQSDWDVYWGPVADRRTSRATWLEFSDYGVVMQAALSGEGIALGWLTVAASALLRGALVPASDKRVRTGRRHHLIASRSRPRRQVVLDIRDWMIAKMAGETEAAETLMKGSGDGVVRRR